MAGLDGYTVVVTADVTANRRANEVPSGAIGAALPAQRSDRGRAGALRDGLRYEDLVAAVDVVMTKPGYGIIAECVANDTALVYTSRGHFVEYDVLVREMPRWLRCGFISNEDSAGRQLAARARRHAGQAGATRDNSRRRR